MCVRIRPGASETDMSLYNWAVSADRTSLLDSSKDGGSAVPFRFNQIFPPQSSTGEVYERAIRANIQQFCAGFNGTIFVYGQTASGKTHTMSGTKDSPGLTPLAIQQIFATMAADSSRMYALKVAYLEVYQEAVNDLLAADPLKSGKDLPMRESAGAFKVQGLTEIICTTAADVLAAIEKGNANRKVGVSNLNEHSSRSHSIFRLTLESAQRTTEIGSPSAAPAGKKLSGAVTVSELSLVDLAGSETLSYDFGSNQRSETKAINLSLTNLKSTIQALSKRESFIPYRNSSLTKLLRTSLGGNSKTILLCTMNPMDVHCKVSRATLGFGQMAQSIVQRATINEVTDDSALMLKQYRSKIESLESKLESYAKLEEEKMRIQREFLALQAHLAELQRREAEQEQLKGEMEAASGMVVGGSDELAASKAAALASPRAGSAVSSEEMAALSAQLSSLQTAKDDLEAAKLALEARLLQQQSLQRATESAIRDREAEIEANNARMEREQSALHEMETLLAQKLREEQEREARDAMLQRQLAEAQKQQSAKAAESAALANELAKAQSQSAALAAAHAKAEADYASQMALLDAARRKHDQQASEMLRLQSEQRDREASMQKQLAVLKAQSAAASSAAALRMKEFERQAAAGGMDKDSYLAALIDGYETSIDKLKASLDEAESVRLVQQLDFTDKIEQMQRVFQKRLAVAGATALETGAQAGAMPPVAQPIHGRSGSASSSSSSAASPAKPNSASSSSSSAGVFTQPAASFSAPSASLPALVIPGHIESAESESLLHVPALQALPLCTHCSSRDRIRAEKLRSLCVHACKTMAHFQSQNASQEKQIAGLKSEVSMYQLQLREYGLKQR